MHKYPDLGTWPGDRMWRLAIVVVLVIGLALGLAIGDDFGASTDEYANVLAGQMSAAEYAGVEGEYADPLPMGDHGPVYFMLWSYGGRLIHRLLPGWTRSDGRHLVNYAVFLCGMAVFFALSRKLMSPRSAWMATLFFATQPMLFGYAFINQKDVPFMVLFMSAISAGVMAVDRFHSLAAQSEAGCHLEAHNRLGSVGKAIAGDLGRLSGTRKIALGIFVIGSALIAREMLRPGWAYNWGSTLVQQAYSGRAPEAIQHVFSRAASDAYKTPLDAYLAKFEQGYRLLRLVAIPAIGLALIAAFAHSALAFRVELLAWARGKYPPLLAAGGLLGLAVCVRQVGLLAGALVSLYMIYRLRGRALPGLFAYWSSAALAVYATWPYLWPDPFGRFWQSVTSLTRFGSQRVLYRGAVLRASGLPWHYFPTLASLKLTEPAVALFLLGIPIMLVRAKVGETPKALVGLLGAWIAIPVGAVMLGGVTVYDNIRHLLFVVPPMMIVAGVGLDAILRRVRLSWMRGGLCLLVLAPGIVGILAMHPYEYAYFNSFIGGVSGASQHFETDYWCTSFREAIELVNERAILDATVLVNMDAANAKSLKREDLTIVTGADWIPSVEYILVCTGRPHSDPVTPEFDLIHQVKRGDAVFANVWERRDKGSPNVE